MGEVEAGDVWRRGREDKVRKRDGFRGVRLRERKRERGGRELEEILEERRRELTTQNEIVLSIVANVRSLGFQDFPNKNTKTNTFNEKRRSGLLLRPKESGRWNGMGEGKMPEGGVVEVESSSHC